MPQITLQKPATFICFSGGCFAGKSTTIDAVKRKLSSTDVKVDIMDEIMRRQKIVSIDDLRDDPSAYLQMQDKIIHERIEHEIAISESSISRIILADRAISDSLFYMTFYINPRKLSNKELEQYNNLLIDITNHCKYAFRYIYDKVYFFNPLQGSEEDRFRPAAIQHLKYIESIVIDVINGNYAQYSGLKNNLVKKFDLNYQGYKDVIPDMTAEILSIHESNQFNKPYEVL